MLAAMIMPIAAKKLWGLSPEAQVVMHAVTVIIFHFTTVGVVREMDSQMLLTMTVASIIAEILSG
jgi:hypothetical protein